jgi:hypothetical protein
MGPQMDANGREWVGEGGFAERTQLCAIVQTCAWGLGGVSPLGQTRVRAARSARWTLNFNAEALRTADDAEEIRITGAADGILRNEPN